MNAPPTHVSDSHFRIGAVSYLNTKPLIWKLAEQQDIELTLQVPARLIDGLRDGRFDVAMLPVIDYQRLAGLRLLSSAGIGSDGTTLTVRIFSDVPIQQIRRLACDRESHTSVALARVVLGEWHGIEPVLVDVDAAAEARLLIGDKVVAALKSGEGRYQLDLGEAWKAGSGLPFVFAAWMARADVELGDLPRRLALAKEAGLANVDTIVTEHAARLGWPPELARRYLTEYLKFDIGPRELAAIRRFHALAAKWGMIDPPVRELIVVDHQLHTP